MDRFDAAKIRAIDILDRLTDVGFDIHDPWTATSVAAIEGIETASGASRLVLWDMCCQDYVVKLGLCEEDNRYCEREVELYNAAVEAGVEDSFAWCAYVGDYRGVPVYAMEFLVCDSDDVYDRSDAWDYENYCWENDLDKDDEESRESYSHDRGYDSSIILDWVESLFPKEYAARFDRFIYEHDIDDIHSANVGYRGTQVVLCDYAGWEG